MPNDELNDEGEDEEDILFLDMNSIDPSKIQPLYKSDSICNRIEQLQYTWDPFQSSYFEHSGTTTKERAVKAQEKIVPRPHAPGYYNNCPPLKAIFRPRRGSNLNDKIRAAHLSLRRVATKLCQKHFAVMNRRTVEPRDGHSDKKLLDGFHKRSTIKTDTAPATVPERMLVKRLCDIKEATSFELTGTVHWLKRVQTGVAVESKEARDDKESLLGNTERSCVNEQHQYCEASGDEKSPRATIFPGETISSAGVNTKVERSSK